MTQLFQDAQMTLSGHRKLAIIVRNIQKRAIVLGYEENFNFFFTKLVSKILKIRKGIAAADRIAKFVSVFVSLLVKEEYNENNDSDVASNFVDNLIRHLLRGIESRFKEVRYRIVQLLAYLVHFIPEMDEQLFTALQFSLNRRLHDKEAVVRIQAVVAMSRFQFHEEDDQEEENKARKLNPATRSLLQAMEHDESPEVRRAALLNLAKNQFTVGPMLRRARDTNAINRRLVYGRVMKELVSLDEVDCELREQLLGWGLHDRDGSVKQAATTAFTRGWVALADNKILDLLEKLNVAESRSAEAAMEAYFEGNSDKLDAVEFKPGMWRELTAEKAFFIRTFLDFCNSRGLYNDIERNLPELTILASYLSDYMALRRKLLDSRTDLVDAASRYEKKLSRFDQLLMETMAEQTHLRRRFDKDLRFARQYEAQLETINGAIQSKKANLAELRRRKRSGGGGADEKEISHCMVEIRDLESESVELSERLSKVNDNLVAGERLLKERAVALAHQEQEKERFMESSSEDKDKSFAFMDEIKELEFVIEQMLKIIYALDFADVAGTRKLQPLVSRMLTNEKMPDGLISLSVAILRKLSNDEGYFSGLCIEIITDIRDSGLDENDQTFVSAASLFDSVDGVNGDQNDENDENDENEDDNENENIAKRRRVAPEPPSEEILTQCLMVLQHYLEVVDDTVSSTHQFDSLIETLIRPAMYSKTWTVRRLGVRCLGLVALLDEYLTVQNLKLFGQYASKMADEELRVVSTQIIFDLLSTFGTGILDTHDENAVDALSLARLFGTMLKEYERPRIQAVVAEGLCKLFLADLMESFGTSQPGQEDEEDEETPQIEDLFLRSLLTSYFHPLNASHQELHQVLAFCIPVYSFSTHKHQLKLAMASGDCFYDMFGIHNKFSDYTRHVTPATVFQQLVYWCDPRNVVNRSDEDLHRSDSHFWQVLKFLEVVEQDSPRAVKKLILSNLHRFYLHEALGIRLLTGLKSALEDTREVLAARVAENNPEFTLDAPTERSLEKFEKRVSELLLRAPEPEPEPEPEPQAPETETDSRVPEAEPEPPVEQEPEPEQEPEQEPEGDEENNHSREQELQEIDEMLDEEDRVEYKY